MAVACVQNMETEDETRQRRLHSVLTLQPQLLHVIPHVSLRYLILLVETETQ